MVTVLALKYSFVLSFRWAGNSKKTKCGLLIGACLWAPCLDHDKRNTEMEKCLEHLNLFDTAGISKCMIRGGFIE